MARVEVEILSLPPRAAAGVRSRAGVQPAHRPQGPLLRADAQPVELLALADRESGVEPRTAEGVRRLHRPGLDRHVADAEHVSRDAEGANLRDRVPGIRRDAES